MRAETSIELLLAPLAFSFDATIRKVALSLFRRMDRGAILVVDPLGRELFGDGADPERVTVTVHDLEAYRALFFGGTIGAGEAYVKGWWSVDDLALCVRLILRNERALARMEGGAARLGLALGAWAASLAKNTRAQSRRNIARHYDLSNDLFRTFLDETLTYSCAVFDGDTDSLEAAQLRKLDRICDKLELQPSDHLLEIGTGWGSLAIFAARTRGCRVTTTTLSVEQAELATARVKEAGLEDRVRILLRDYRDLEGTYDKLVSVEMVEAVGHDFMGQYLRTCGERLTEKGSMLLQAITIRDQSVEEHRSNDDFIKRYIFPGSSIPSVTSILAAATDASDLRIHHLEDLTPHYARTLRVWRQRFMDNQSRVKELGFDDGFIRMWEYYLAYCEAGFDERHLGSVQMLFAKPEARLGRTMPSVR